MLPQDAEGDVLGDEGNGNAGDQSNQVGWKDGRYPAVVVTIANVVYMYSGHYVWKHLSNVLGFLSLSGHYRTGD